MLNRTIPASTIILEATIKYLDQGTNSSSSSPSKEEHRDPSSGSALVKEVEQATGDTEVKGNPSCFFFVSFTIDDFKGIFPGSSKVLSIMI